MTVRDINTIIETLCPNDEDYEKPCISPKYLRQELEQLALEQEQRMLEPTTRNCFGCKYSKDNHNADTEKCHLCMWENQYTPTTKNDSSVLDKNSKKLEKDCGELDCISRADVLQILLDYDYANENALVLKDIKALPPVTPQPCDDAVSRQALLNATVHKNSIWNKTTDSKGENLEAIISKLPSVTPKPRWIPVSDYLPVTNDEVLVTYIVNGNTKKRYVETARCFDGEWSSVNDEYRIPNTKIEIIAWCEMPKPYREVEE